MNKLLSNIYYNPANEASFSGAENLIKAVKGKYKPTAVRKWLAAQDTYTMHRPLKKRFTRNRYYVSNLNDIFQADLNDLRKLSPYNDGFKYILTVIDIFSRYAWAIPLENKKPASVINAFKKIFGERKPIYLQTDKGSEFIASSVRTYLKSNDIKYYVTHNPDVKACFVERFNRTLKARMYRYFTYKNTYRYVDVLEKLVSAYNSSKHRSIKMAPIQVNERNVLKVWQSQYGVPKSCNQNIKNKFKIGDFVRISKSKNTFEKGYETNWSEEIFKVYAVSNRNPIVYKIKDLNDEDIEGTFYTEELQCVKKSSKKIYKIDKIIKTDGVGNSKKLFVKWQGYPDKFNSWVLAKNIKHDSK